MFEILTTIKYCSIIRREKIFKEGNIHRNFKAQVTNCEVDGGVNQNRDHKKAGIISAIFNLFHLLTHHKLITKILWHTKKHIVFFADLTKQVSTILIHSHLLLAVVALAVVIFYFTV